MGGRNDGHFRDARIWDLVASMAEDDIAAGGFQSSFTGKTITAAEAKQFVDNTFAKLEPYLSKEGTVALEVGCASGLTMYRIAPYCKKYIGTDMAEVNLKRDQEKNERDGICNIELEQCNAAEIGKFAGKGVNLVILNSVVQYFENEEYLNKVLETAIGIMPSNGIVFVGDVRDKERKEEFEKEVVAYKEEHNIKAKHQKGNGELFLARKYFDSWLKHPRISKVETSNKIGDIMNEFRKYRFDAMLTVI